MAKKKNKATPEQAFVENIREAAMDDIMGDRFGVYAKEVIQNRAIPDVRDGLKPVQRRIIYAMYEDGNTFNRPTKKCAHTVGAVMGKYHPHGDSSIYDALTRMSQDWVMRLPLIDFQGNNGSIDGDAPAAYRYTESRLAEISEQLVRDFNKNTVEMMLTFDDTALEPTVLPARYPNLYVNGAQGIAVGVATEIPPHNLGEIIDAVIYRLKRKNVSVSDLRKFVLAPDFPTGGIIYGDEGLDEIYETGRGRIEIEAKTSIETTRNLQLIVISEIPYAVNKAKIVRDIDEIIQSKKIDGIIDVRDESDREGLRIVVEVKKDADIEIIRDFLLNRTQLRVGYSANIVAIDGGRPKTLNLLDYVDAYIAHQVDVITRRSKFDLEKYEKRLHLVDGLIQAISVVDEVVKIIRGSKDKADAKLNLRNAYDFSEPQAEAIVNLQLYKLTNTDINVLKDEAKQLNEDIKQLNDVLTDEKLLKKIIIDDLSEIKKKFAAPRRSEIGGEREVVTIDKRDLIADEKVMVAVTRDGYIKRSSMNSYIRSGDNPLPGLKPGDILVAMGEVMTTDILIAFTSRGNYLYIPVFEIQDGRWKDEGNHINYLITMSGDEKIVNAFALASFRDDLYFVTLSKKGQIKRTQVSEYEVTRYKRPIQNMRLLKSDEVVSVTTSSGDSNILIVASDGKATLFNENEITPVSTKAGGVKAFSNLKKAHAVEVLTYLPEERGKFLALSEKGHLRILDSNYIEVTARTGRMQFVWKLFKSSPHQLIYASKLKHTQESFVLNTLTTKGNQIALTIDDLRPTMPDKYAKTNIDELPKGEHFISGFREELIRIDDETLAFTPKGEEEDKPEVNSKEEPSKIDIDEDDDYEQISIFDVMGD
ncbi:MAG: DNA topoisomerase IV subunit A [Erysipelotrichaceae bacterium]|nr:DNA topoisomerase IV subunit A [Erysipelotrichaceae bacterium]